LIFNITKNRKKLKFFFQSEEVPEVPVLIKDGWKISGKKWKRTGKWFCVWKQGLQIIVICRELIPRPLLLEKEGEKEIEKQ